MALLRRETRLNPYLRNPSPRVFSPILGIIGYSYATTRFVEGQMIFEVKKKMKHLRCFCCGSQKVICRKSTSRMFRTLPVGVRPVVFDLPVQRIECQKCGLVRRQIALDVAATQVSELSKIKIMALHETKYAFVG